MIDEYMDYLRNEVKKSEKTTEGYHYDLDYFQRFIECDLLGVNNETARAYLRYLNERGLKERSVLRKIAACKSFYRWLKGRRRIEYNPFDDMELPRVPDTLPRDIPERDFDALMSFPASSELDIRDRAMLDLMYSAGVRVGELYGINADDVDLDGHEITILGKGNKERIVIFGDRCEMHLRDYLDKARPKLTRQGEPALFVNSHGHRLAVNGIQWMMRERSMKAVGKVITPHQLRHSFATALVNGDVDMPIISQLLGHASTDTTRIYARIKTSTLHRAYEQVHPRAPRQPRLRIVG